MNDTAAKDAVSPPGQALKLRLDSAVIEKELALTLPSAPAAGKDEAELERRAQAYVDYLMNAGAVRPDEQEQGKQAVETMGHALQGQAAHRSRMLQQTVAVMSSQGSEKGPVTNALIDLKLKVEELDPNHLDLDAGWFMRLAGRLPGVGTPLKRYFSRFESAQTVLDAIVNSLERGREQLKRDNLTLQEDQKAMRELTEKLSRQIRLGQLVDEKLQLSLARLGKDEEARAHFVEGELLFPLRQRIIDLQQQLAVNQQGLLASAIVMRNNSELVRGVNRALDVTVSALNVAVSTALALGNQRIVLDKVNAINRTTSDLISGTAKKLRTQGAAIHAQASTAMIEMNALKSAFADINAALDEISRFRQSALPQMAKTIIDLDRLSAEGEKRVRQLPATSAEMLLLDLEA
jgi:uncharacterized protein YaaN involved in tellurite resistance